MNKISLFSAHKNLFFYRSCVYQPYTNELNFNFVVLYFSLKIVFNGSKLNIKIIVLR